MILYSDPTKKPIAKFAMSELVGVLGLEPRLNPPKGLVLAITLYPVLYSRIIPHYAPFAKGLTAICAASVSRRESVPPLQN